MKQRMLGAALALSLIGVLALAVFGSSPTEAMGRLGISADSARNHVWNSLSSGYFAYPALPALKNVPAGERAVIVTLIGGFARSYTESSDFAQRYAQFREHQRPQPPSPPQTAEQMRQEQIDRMSESIRQTEESLKTMPESEKTMMVEMVAEMKRQVAELSDPANPMFGKELDEVMNQGYQAELEQHRQALAAWETTLPEDPRQFVRRRLEEFLKESEGIDYRAELKPGAEGKMVFVNPVYESKPRNWKLCYRIGEETVSTARLFAQSWLTDLLPTD